MPGKQQRTLFSGRLIKVIENVISFEDHEAALEAFKVPAVALIVPVTSNEEYVLVEQYRHAVDEACLEFPAGKIEEGESALNAAKRELLEETGSQAVQINFMGTLLSSPEYGDEVVHVFHATECRLQSPSRTVYEEIKIHYLSNHSILALIRSGTIRDAKTIAAHMMVSLR